MPYPQCVCTVPSIDITYAIWKTEHTDRQTNILVAMVYLCLIISAPWLLEKMIFGQLVKKLSAVYGNRLYIKMLTTASHKPNPSWVKPTALLYVLPLGLLRYLFPADFPLLLYMLLYLLRHTTRVSAHPILCDLITLVKDRENQYWSFSWLSAILCTLLSAPSCYLFHRRPEYFQHFFVRHPSSTHFQYKPRFISTYSKRQRLSYVYLKLQAFWHNTGR